MALYSTTVNAALEHLQVLVGEWTVEVSAPAYSSDVVRGRTVFEWLNDGAFLVMRTEMEGEGPPDSVSVIGRDDAIQPCHMLYFDERGVSRVYELTLSDRAWTMSRRSPGFNQRFIGTLSDDGNLVTARWEKSVDGATWEHDFDLTYRRTSISSAGRWAKTSPGVCLSPNTGSTETDLREYARLLIGWLTSLLGRAVLAATISDAARAEPEIAELE